MEAKTEVPQWHRDIADAARHVLKPGWCGIVTLKSDGECRHVPERTYKRRQDAFAQATRLLHDAELSSAGSLTPNYYVVERNATQLIVWAGPGYPLYIEGFEYGLGDRVSYVAASTGERTVEIHGTVIDRNRFTERATEIMVLPDHGNSLWLPTEALTLVRRAADRT
jgi:hypothetical protein